ncbi:MAG TPA: hypothetical protein VFA60_05640 [Terriglobales bacterium]|nr:hypothetical protein [Terriglobales bacterium]
MRAAIVLALLTLVLQAVSATWVVHSFESPNGTTLLARTWLRRGEYGLFSWQRLVGWSHVASRVEPLRMFHLPGAAVYQLAVFETLPEPFHRYQQLPITLLFVLAVFRVATLAGGTRAGAAAGFLAACYPFMVVHGPVWDDAMLGAALEWAALAMIVSAIMERSESRPWWRAATLALLCGYAALVRAESQVTMAATAVTLILAKRVRLRREGMAMLLGVAIAVFAWGERNRSLTGSFFTGTSHDGITLYESNYDHAMEALLTRGQVEVLNETYMQAEFTHAATLGNELEMDRYFRQLGVEQIRSHPVRTLRWGVVKLAVTLTGVGPQFSLVSLKNLVALGSSLALYALAMAGYFGMRRGPAWREALMPGLFLAVALPTVVGALIGPAGFRYQMPLLGMWFVMGGAGLWQMTSLRDRDRLRRHRPVEREQARAKQVS